MIDVVYVSLDEWIEIAVQILQLDRITVTKVANLDLADSALHAPQAGFGDTEFYPGLLEKAAVLGWHLAQNHALPDGNKRTAFTAMIVFLRRNGATWRTPDRSDAVKTMFAVAGSRMDIETFATWVAAHATPPS
jgi:death on curing protein